MDSLANKKFVREVSLIVTTFLFTVIVHAQSMSISGPTCITPGTQYQYMISGNWNGSTYMQWCVSGGTITGYGQCASGTPLPSVYIIWSSGGSHGVTLTTSNPSSNPSKTVYENVTFFPGSITSNSSQTVNAATTPGTINCSAATGGNCGAINHSYQWQQSSDNVNFSNFSSTAQNLVFTQPLTSSTYFRRKVTETNSNTIGYSDVAVVFVDPLIGGTMISSPQFIPYNTIPANILATDPSAGTCGGAYVYQWQKSTDNVNFTDISSATLNYLSFSSPVTQTAYYRRKTTCAGEIKYTGSVKVTVATWPGTAGSSQVIASGGSISAFSLTGVAGGDCGGSYSYQWQQSINDIDWTNVSGATSTTYTPPLPGTYMYYRVKVSCGSEVVYSNKVRIKNAAPTTNASVPLRTPAAIPAYPASTDPNNINYVRTRSFTKPGITDITTANAQTDKFDVSQVTEYLDGLGRSIQSVAKYATPTGHDLIATSFYDAFGRVAQKYLPYTDNLATGSFRLDPASQQPAFYNSHLNNTESFYYSETRYESSPSNDVLQQTPPGKSWTGIGLGGRVETRSNTTAEDVKKWTIGYTTGSVPSVIGVYSDGKLIVTMTSDEHDIKVLEYKTIEGQLILKKVQLTDPYQTSYAGWLSTYYIYDDLNLLRFVIQPRGVDWLTANNWNFAASGGTQVADEFCFRYEYDKRRRMIVKKVPGKGEEWMVYDTRDRLIMTQDANFRTQAKWLYTEYDNLNRPFATGITYDSHDQAYNANLAETTSPYPNLGAMGYELNTHTLYDDYSWLPNYPVPSSFTSNRITTYDNYLLQPSNTTWPYAQPVAQSNALKGMVTGSRVFIPGLGYSGDIFYSVNFYDDKGRLIQTQSNNITGGIDITITQYNWSGQPLLVIQKNEKAGGTNPQTHLIISKYEYDDKGRLLIVKKAVNSTVNGVAVNKPEQTILQNEYDKLGQLKSKKLAPAYNSNAGLETLNYDYNIRGWTLGMNRGYVAGANSNYFGFELSYDKTTTSVTQTFDWHPQYNGNIGANVWKSKGDGMKRVYDFFYDNVSRLTQASYLQSSDGASWNRDMDFSQIGKDGDNGYRIKYDNNGNILGMVNQGVKIGNPTATIDALQYDYQLNSNKLQRVYDIYNDPNAKLGDFHDGPNGSGNDYDYDLNGNLILDNNKSINSITYNHLNLPTVITVTNKGTITYTYNALGNKLKKVVNETGQPLKTTLYLAGAVYENDVLQFFDHEEGRIRFRPSDNSLQYDYLIKDHLGNVRMVLTEESQQNFYPAATLEGTYSDGSTAVGYEKNFYTIDQSKIVPNSEATGIENSIYQNNNGISNPYPAGHSGNSNAGNNSTKLYKLTATGIAGVTGLGITLKVMSGDKIDIHGKSYYFQNATGSNNVPLPVNDIINGLFGAPASTAGMKGAASEVIAQSNLTTPVTNFLNDGNRGGGTVPKAYVNYILFDENFKFVSGSFSRVGSNSVVKSHYGDAQMQNIPVTKNGYLYVYVSNESPVHVFFDNLQVVHTRGPILEETHYYPFGLTMAGISSKALAFGNPENKYKYNSGSEFQNKEFSDGSGLELYATLFRSLDPQLGRFWQLDPKPNSAISLYAAMENNPILNSDPLGDTIINGEKHEAMNAAAATMATSSPVVVISYKPNPFAGAMVLNTAACHMTNGEVYMAQLNRWNDATKNLDRENGQIMPPRSELEDLLFGHRSALNPELSDEMIEWLENRDLLEAVGYVNVGANGYIIGTRPQITAGTPPAIGMRGVPIPSLSTRAMMLANRIGKNRVSISTTKSILHFDLKSTRRTMHAGVPVPHVQRSVFHTNPNTGQVFANRDPRWVRPLTEQDLRVIRKYLEKKGL